MKFGSFTKWHTVSGRAVSWMVASLITAYLTTLILGFISLKSPDDPIADPYFTILELLIIILATLMVFSLAIVHRSTPDHLKVYSLTALVIISIMTCITCCLHFMILTLSYQEEFLKQTWWSFVFSFKWPSLAYAMDILAWDFFYALSMFSLSATFQQKGVERILQIFLILSSTFSLAGLFGIPLNNMQIRNIGIIGYTLLAIVVFILLGVVLQRRTNQGSNRQKG